VWWWRCGAWAGGVVGAKPWRPQQRGGSGPAARQATVTLAAAAAPDGARPRPPRPRPRSGKRTWVTTPATGAHTAVSIFMALITTSCCPALTGAPGLTATCSGQRRGGRAARGAPVRSSCAAPPGAACRQAHAAPGTDKLARRRRAGCVAHLDDGAGHGRAHAAEVERVCPLPHRPLAGALRVLAVHDLHAPEAAGVGQCVWCGMGRGKGGGCGPSPTRRQRSTAVAGSGIRVLNGTQRAA
jgi:hypothetical protein